MAVKASDTVTLVRVTDGTSVKKVEVYYYLSTSNTAQSGGSWSTTVPTWSDGKYMWSKTKTTLSDGTTTETTPVCITGAKGSTGSTGATGKGVASITAEYYLSTSKTTQTGGSWVTTAPAWSTGKYMWTRSKIVYSNPSSTAYTTAICDSSWEAVKDLEDKVKAEIKTVTDTVTDFGAKADKIISRMETIEETTTTIGDNLVGVEKRVKSAEEVIKPESIVSTVRKSTEYTNDLGEKVSENEIISCINQTAEKIKILAPKIEFEGLVTANQYFKINTDGSMEAKAGKIASFNIGNTYIQNTTGTVGFGSEATWAFWAGGSTIATAKFRVDQAGNLYAKSGEIAGFKFDDKYIRKKDDTVGFGTESDWAFWAGGSTTATAKFRVDQSGKVYATSGKISIFDISNEGFSAVLSGKSNISIKDNIFSYNVGSATVYVQNNKIGLINNYGNESAMLDIEGGVIKLTTTGAILIQSGGNNVNILSGTNGLSIWDSGKCVTPYRDAATSSGTASYRWSKVYAVSASISTSDRRLKSDIKRIDDRFAAFYMDLKPRSYIMLEVDEENYHIGFIAQDVEKSLIDNGIESNEFSAVQHDYWIDEDGKQQDRYGLAYEEFIALNTMMIQKNVEEIKKLKNENLDLNDRVQKLEELVSALIKK